MKHLAINCNASFEWAMRDCRYPHLAIEPERTAMTILKASALTQFQSKYQDRKRLRRGLMEPLLTDGWRV